MSRVLRGMIQSLPERASGTSSLLLYHIRAEEIAMDLKHCSCIKLNRRALLALAGGGAFGAITPRTSSPQDSKRVLAEMRKPMNTPPGNSNLITMFMCGDVMVGRGVDQVLPRPSNPRIHERYLKNSIRYVEIAEKANGPIPKPVDFSYVWGDALKELEQASPDVRIINLETAVTKSEDFWKGKGIHYRMHPENIACITAAKIDCCTLANNHVLDWGYSGLEETLEALKEATVKTAGAGRNIGEAEAPAVMELPGKGRVLVFAFGSQTSGIPRSWAAAADRPGVNLLKDLSEATVRRIANRVRRTRRLGDIVVASIHWGSNWGYRIPDAQRTFAHRLIDETGVDAIHGHSSHHPRAVEVYRQKPILYGCGDLLNDYEGISGHEALRDDLGLMYLVRMDPSTGKLDRLQMIPTQIKGFRVNRASTEDGRWLTNVLNRECNKLGTRVELNDANALTLRWDREAN